MVNIVNNYSSMLFLIGPSHVEATFHTLKAQLRLFPYYTGYVQLCDANRRVYASV